MKQKWSDLLKQGDGANGTTPDFRQILKETRAEEKKEDSERESKENNLIIYRVAESTKSAAEERVLDDKRFLDELCASVLEIPDMNVKKVIRVGPKQGKDGEPRQTPRPLKVVLDSKESKNKLLRNLYKLKNAEQKFNQISVTQDYSKDDRDKIQAKVAEANKLNSEEKPKNFRYRVRGPPWDLKIVKITKTEGN